MRLKLAYKREEMWIDFHEDAPVNVAQALQSVKERQPDMYRSWCDAEGRLRPSLAVFVNREHIRYQDGLETKLNDGDELYVIPVMAGG